MAPRPYPRAHRSPAGGFAAISAVIATVCLGLGASACGSSPTGRAAVSGPILLQQAAAALANVPAVRVTGTVVSKVGSATDTVSVDATSAGASGTSAGTLKLEGPAMGFTGSTQYITIGGTTYVNAGSVFWKSLFGKQTATAVHLEAELLPKIVNQWVSLPATSTDNVYKDSLGLSEPKVFVADTITSAKGTLSNAGNQSLNGAGGVQINSTTGAKILVAAGGPALPLAVSDSETKSSGSFALNLAISYPTGVTVAAPAHSVSLSAIEASVKQ
ncbi:MAG: hypothetical protein ABSD78_09555 [Acidimicrobiales bacterium]